MVRIFDFTTDGVTVKLAVPKESMMEAHIEEGAKMVEEHKINPIPAKVWTARRRRLIADCMNLATPNGTPWTQDRLAEEFDSGVLNAMSTAIYEKCGIKTAEVGEAKAVA